MGMIDKSDKYDMKEEGDCGVIDYEA